MNFGMNGQIRFEFTTLKALCTERRNIYMSFYHIQGNNETERKEPKIKLLGSGSDHAPFAFYATIPGINLRFKDDSKKYKGIGQYPTYHTGFETFYLMAKIVDPGFKIHRTCAQVPISLRTLFIVSDLVDFIGLQHGYHNKECCVMQEFIRQNLLQKCFYNIRLPYL